MLRSAVRLPVRAALARSAAPVLKRTMALGPDEGIVLPDGRRRITVANGDGIGPEIMDATLRVLDAAGARLDYQYVEIGEKVYSRGISSGIEESGWDSLTNTRVFLKSPITTPLGGGVKSLNVTCRKTLGLYANVRPVKSYHPFVPGLHEKMDMVIVRENEEDLYAGIEHRHTSEVLQCIKLISIPGSERIARYAFEYARNHGRKKVTCITKNNIMKLTDGAFYDAFKRVAAEFPEIEADHMIVDIATARVATRPAAFDVIVTLNLYGDIISDVAADVCGSVGLAGSANIGERCAMFEAIHGSAPDIAGQNMANPSGLINGAVMMLGHIGQHDVARNLKNALLTTLENGIHTPDIYREGVSKQLAGCSEFADAVIKNIGQTPRILRAAEQESGPSKFPPVAEQPSKKVPQKPVLAQPPVKQFVGVDIFVDWEGDDRDPEVLAGTINGALNNLFSLQMISNRGVKVWPHGHPETYKVNHWRCRIMANDVETAETRFIPSVMAMLSHAGLDVIKTENLYNYDGAAGYSLGQGQQASEALFGRGVAAGVPPTATRVKPPPPRAILNRLLQPPSLLQFGLTSPLSFTIYPVT